MNLQDEPSAVLINATSLDDAVRGAVGKFGGLDKVLVVHWDLVAITRRAAADPHDPPFRHWWTTPGSDPHCSYAALDIQAQAIAKRLTASRNQDR